MIFAIFLTVISVFSCIPIFLKPLLFSTKDIAKTPEAWFTVPGLVIWAIGCFGFTIWHWLSIFTIVAVPSLGYLLGLFCLCIFLLGVGGCLMEISPRKIKDADEDSD